MALDLTKLSPEDIDQLKAMLGVKSDDQRSPIWRPLKDLRPPTTAKGRLNRPHFEWSAEEPPEGVVIQPFPRLYWDQNGNEVRLDSADELKRVQPGWTSAPPMANAVSAQDRLNAEIAMLSDEDRAFLFKQHREARLNSLKEQMLGLSHADIADLTAAHAAPDAPVAEPKVTEKKKTA